MHSNCMDVRTRAGRTYPGGAYPYPAAVSAALFLDVVQLADPLLQLLGRLIGCGEDRVATAASLHQRRPDGRHQLGPTRAEKQTWRESAGKLIYFGQDFSFLQRNTQATRFSFA